MPIRNEFAGYYLMFHIQSKSFVLGCTTKLKRRFTEHKRDLKAGKEKNTRFQQLFIGRWKIFQTKMANQNVSQEQLIEMFFPSFENYEKYQNTAEFVWIVLQELPIRSSKEMGFSDEEVLEIRKELQAYEKFYAEQIQKKFAITSLNFWMEPSTEDREGNPVCIDGVFYANKVEAARQQNLFFKGKPHKQLVANRLESSAYPKWCYVQDNKLIKRLRVQDSLGRRKGSKIVEVGKVEMDKNNQPVAIYLEFPSTNS